PNALGSRFIGGDHMINDQSEFEFKEAKNQVIKKVKENSIHSSYLTVKYKHDLRYADFINQ
ncbi:15379_t:CDS:1, partial [Cetraspora pellucida]